MGRKMKLPFLSKNTNTSSWPWPSCHQPRTLSFRNTTTTTTTTIMFKTINSAYIDTETTDSSLFTNTPSSESATATASFSTASEEHCSSGDPIETVIRGLRSERLFFEPGRETSSILEEAKIPFKESLVLSMESQDPYIDFKKSMEEMVEAHGIKDWEDLEELLCWYLRMNGKSNHGYIVGAFVDLLVALAFASATSSSNSNGDFITGSSSSLASCSPSSPLSFYTSSSDDSSSTPCCCLSSLLEAEDEEDEIQKQQTDDVMPLKS